MPTSYTPTSTYHPQILLPAPGDAATAASVNAQALKYLADNSAVAKAIVDSVYTRRVPISTSRGGGANYDVSRLFYPASALGPEGVNSVIAGTLSSDVSWTIDDTSAVNGDWFFVANMSTTFSITINTPHAPALQTLAPGDWCMFERSGGDWGFTSRRVAREGLFLDGPLTIATGGANIAGGLHAQGGGSIDGNLFVNGVVRPSSVIADGDVAASSATISELSTTRLLNVGDPVAGSSPFTVDELGTVTSPVANLARAFISLGLGRFVFPVIATNVTPRFLNAASANVYYTTINAAAVWTIQDTGQNGDWIHCYSAGPGPVSIYSPAGVLLATLTDDTWAMMMRIDNVWYLVAS